jgi:hypothetical protein
MRVKARNDPCLAFGSKLLFRHQYCPAYGSRGGVRGGIGVSLKAAGVQPALSPAYTLNPVFFNIRLLTSISSPRHASPSSSRICARYASISSALRPCTMANRL